ncbi:MAG: hypothetical protein H0W30_01815 [Gemmatimonadaceae bacterium]|nr:hypothetical protein [Gemmatimonadaceae bacterium]
MQPAVEVEVVDLLIGEPAAQGARGAIHEGSSIDSLRPHAGRSDGTLLTLSAGGRPGTFRVELRKPGYRDWSRNGVTARGGDCGVRTTQVRAELQPAP